MRSSLRLMPGVAGALLLAFVSGCGGESLATVEGEVSYNGTPIDSGAVVFEPTEPKKAKKGARIFDGKYSITESDKMEPGKYKVIFNWNKKTGKKMTTGDGPEKMDETKEGLPPQFSTSASTQTAEVKEGKNTLNFPLTDGKK